MKYVIYFILASIEFCGCTKTTTFVADAANSQLPEYSESGKNIAGAIFNDTTWRSDVYSSGLSGTYLTGCWIFSSLSGDSTTIILNGKHSDHSINFVETLPSVPLSFFFVIKGLKIENQDSLLKLNGKTFDVGDNHNYVTLAYADDHFNFLKKGASIGNIVFIKAGRVAGITIGDGSPGNPVIYPFIVSGHFDFMISGTNSYHVKDGRFDMVAQWKTNLVITQ